jgi:hypothetical protein
MSRVIALVFVLLFSTLSLASDYTFKVVAPKGKRVELVPVLTMTASVEQETGKRVEDKTFVHCKVSIRVTQMTLPSGERLPVYETVFECDNGMLFRMVGANFTKDNQ